MRQAGTMAQAFDAGISVTTRHHTMLEQLHSKDKTHYTKPLCDEAPQQKTSAKKGEKVPQPVQDHAGNNAAEAKTQRCRKCGMMR